MTLFQRWLLYGFGGASTVAMWTALFWLGGWGTPLPAPAPAARTGPPVTSPYCDARYNCTWCHLDRCQLCHQEMP
jgi:hypothetical protein